MKIKMRFLYVLAVLIIFLVGFIIYNMIILLHSHAFIAAIVKDIRSFSTEKLTLSLITLQNRFIIAAIIITVIGLCAIITSIITHSILSAKIINPVFIVTHAMKEVAKKNYNVTLQLPAGDEFGELAQICNTIIKQVKTGNKLPGNRDYSYGDMEIARRIQLATCPPVPAHDELDIAASMSPAQEVGGDYYDLVLDNDKNLWIGIGDVSGNGVVPGMIVLMAETAFNNYVLEKGTLATPRNAIVSINKTLTENIRIRLNQKYFMSMNFLKYSGSGEFLQAGSHLDIIVYRSKTKTCDIYPTDGVYMGIIPDISSHTADKTFHMDIHDIMVVYTNGVIEARNKNNIENLFGISALIDTIVENGDKDASFIMEAIRVKVLDWCGNKPGDDITVVVVKRMM